MHKSARRKWNSSNSSDRNQMLLSVGIRQRTLTLRAFTELPPEIILDINYAYELQSNKPLGRSSTNSQSSGGFVASADSSVLMNPAPLAVTPAAFFYSQASGR